MAPAIQSWLLAVPYLFTGFGFLFLAWAAGGYAYGLVCGRRSSLSEPWYMNVTGAGSFLLMVRVAAGLALISWVSALFGVTGFFRREIVLPVLVPVIVGGMVAASRLALPHGPLLRRDRLNLGHDWITASRPEKWLTAAVVLWACALAVNAVIGALVPDMNQDPMWYHLSVPQQWLFDQRFAVYPDVMPSAYPLAVESLYATIFLLKVDPVLCSILVSFCGVLLFVAMASAASVALSSEPADVLRGWGVAAVVGVWAPMLAVYGLIAPVQPKNDIVAMFLTFTGVMTVWLPLLGARQVPARGWWVVAGFILGTACSAKPPVLGITFLTMAFAAPLAMGYERRRERAFPRETVTGACVAVAAMLVAMAPWIYRGLTSHGLPFYPLGRSYFAVAPDYQPLINTFDDLHGIAGPRLLEWFRYASRLPERLSYAGANGEKGVFLFIAVSVIGLVAGRGRWRWFAAILAAHLLILVGMKGAAEVFRFFAPAYAVAAALVAWLVATYARQLQNRTRVLVGALVWFSLAGSVGWHQYRIARFKTMNWKFRPVLAREDVTAYASHAEKGWLVLDYPAIASQIDPAERVLLLRTTYPFYLHRDVLWNDEGIGDGGLADRWRKMSSREAKQFLDNQKIDIVVVAAITDPSGEFAQEQLVADTLVEAGLLEPVKLPEQHELIGWRLYRVIP